LKCSKNIFAFEAVMKLMFGFKDVKIPLELLNEVYMILLEMGINNKEKFRESVESILLQNLSRENIFEVYEMSLQFDKDNIRNACLDFIKNRNFKDLIDNHAKFLSLEENAFKSIMKFHTIYKNERIAQEKSENPDLYLDSKELLEVIQKYCTNKYLDESERNKKQKEFMDAYLVYSVNEPAQNFQILYVDHTYDDMAFLPNKLQMAHTNITKHEKLIQDLASELRELKTTHSIIAKQEKLNEDLTSEVKKLKDELTAFKSMLDDRNLSEFVDASKQLRKLTEIKYLKTNFIDLSGKMQSTYNSSLFQNSMYSKIQEWIGDCNCVLKLLYKGSRDGFTSALFRYKCGYKAPTICFIKSKDYNKIFGGYTELSWGQSAIGVCDDPNAFIFSVTNQEKYAYKKNGKAIYNHTSYLPSFGVHDFLLSNSCNTAPNNTCAFPTSYTCANYASVSSQSHEYLCGGTQFCVEEIEIYKVCFY